MGVLWSELPDEMQKLVLSFLPVPDLCRYRSVCKRWNTLISAPEFGKLCTLTLSNNGTSKGECCVFNLNIHFFRSDVSNMIHSYDITCWSIFDLNARKWYNIKNDLFPSAGYENKAVIAMDGGLVCTLQNVLWRNGTPTLTVTNLIGKTIKVLRDPPMPHKYLPFATLTLVVDNISRTYKIFLTYFRHWETELCNRICVYESSTDQWRSSPNPVINPRISKDQLERRSDYTQSVVFQGKLYGLFTDLSGAVQLFLFNFVRNVWEDTEVKIPQPFYLGYLVASENRLFLMRTCMLDESLVMRSVRTFWPVNISEILLADKDCRTVVRMTQAEVCRAFDVSLHRPSDSINIMAYAFDKSLLLASKTTRNCMLYNLVTGLWESLPPNPLESLNYSCNGYGVGRQMNYLRLPNADPW